MDYMKERTNILCISIFMILIMQAGVIAADGTGSSRAVFTRSGWIGARYVGLGMAAEVLVNDIYAIYWNPAGISELRGQKRMTLDEIKDKARSGEADKITEEDLLRFSEDEKEKPIFQIGMTGAILDLDRNAAFTADFVR